MACSWRSIAFWCIQAMRAGEEHGAGEEPDLGAEDASSPAPARRLRVLWAWSRSCRRPRSCFEEDRLGFDGGFAHGFGDRSGSR